MVISSEGSGCQSDTFCAQSAGCLLCRDIQSHAYKIVQIASNPVSNSYRKSY